MMEFLGVVLVGYLILFVIAAAFIYCISVPSQDEQGYYYDYNNYKPNVYTGSYHRGTYNRGYSRWASSLFYERGKIEYFTLEEIGKDDDEEEVQTNEDVSDFT